MKPTLHQYATFAQAWRDPHAQIDSDKTYEMNDKRKDSDPFVVVVNFLSWRCNSDGTEVEIITAEMQDETRFLKQETKKYTLTNPTDIACMLIMLLVMEEQESDNEELHELLGTLGNAEMAADDPALFPDLLLDSNDMVAIQQEFTGDWRREFVRDCFNF